jgi:hypothetical protein
MQGFFLISDPFDISFAKTGIVVEDFIFLWIVYFKQVPIKQDAQSFEAPLKLINTYAEIEGEGPSKTKKEGNKVRLVETGCLRKTFKSFLSDRAPG